MSTPEKSADLDLEQVRERLLPVIRSANAMNADLLQMSMASGHPKAPPPHRPFAGFFMIYLVIDSDMAMASVNDSALERWGLTFDEALTIATRNLATLDARPLIAVRPGLFRSPWLDAYDTSRILMDRRIDALDFRGDPVALLPNRECLLLADAADDGALARMVELGTQEFKAPRFLSAVPLIRQGGTWQPYASTSTAPGAQALTRLGRDARMREYQDQLTHLEALHALGGGNPPFVAPVKLTTRFGREQTWTSWTRDAPTLLPEADLVGFVDLDRPEAERTRGIYRWEDVERECAELLKPLGMAPERWLTTGFPGDEVLERMKRGRVVRCL